MAMIFVCTGCYRTTGVDGDANYCSECQSYKYFGWSDDEGEEDDN